MKRNAEDLNQLRGQMARRWPKIAGVIDWPLCHYFLQRRPGLRGQLRMIWYDLAGCLRGGTRFVLAILILFAITGLFNIAAAMLTTTGPNIAGLLLLAAFAITALVMKFVIPPDDSRAPHFLYRPAHLFLRQNHPMLLDLWLPPLTFRELMGVEAVRLLARPRQRLYWWLWFMIGMASAVWLWQRCGGEGLLAQIAPMAAWLFRLGVLGFVAALFGLFNSAEFRLFLASRRFCAAVERSVGESTFAMALIMIPFVLAYFAAGLLVCLLPCALIILAVAHASGANAAYGLAGGGMAALAIAAIVLKVRLLPWWAQFHFENFSLQGARQFEQIVRQRAGDGQRPANL